MTDFYIVDMRPVWRNRDRYVTFWRPDDKGYAWPLSWAGRYSKETVDAAPGYYTTPNTRKDGKPGKSFERFPVPCHVVDAMAVPPRPGDIDGDKGPVVMNTAENRAALRRAKYIPPRRED